MGNPPGRMVATLPALVREPLLDLVSEQQMRPFSATEVYD
jgi:hypothetical protein